MFCLHSLSKLRYTVSYNHVYKHRILVIIKGIANCFCKKVYVSYLRLIDEPSKKPDDKTKMLIHNLHLLTGAGHKQIFLVVAYKQPARMFKCWIVKSIFYAICWIAIYPVHSAIQHLHEWPLGMLFMGVAQDLLVVSSFKYWLHSTDCLLPLNAKMLQAIRKVLTISWSGFPISRACMSMSMSLLLSQQFPKPPWTFRTPLLQI